MLYETFGKTGILVSKLGIGMNRFSPRDLNEEKGLHKAAEIVVKAIEEGVNYFDSSFTYSKGKAEEILRLAFQNTKKECHVTVKAAITMDKTADEVLRRIDNSLKAMKIPKATFFNAWTITSYQEYCEIMKKGGYYEGAQRAKELGMIEHICFATHASPKETIKIIQEGAFDGVTINYSVLNERLNQPILEAAEKAKIGVVTMSALGTGIIPKNPDYFDFIKMNAQESVTQAALYFVCAHPQVTLALSGVSSMEQLEKNIQSFCFKDAFKSTRVETIQKRFQQKKEYCTGCKQCEDCPSQIPVSTFMQSNNASLFANEEPAYGRTNFALLKNIQIFKKMKQDYGYIPENEINPCIHCGRCEKNCPQNLPIQKTVAEIYSRAAASGFSIRQWKERLRKLIIEPGYTSFGFYPAGGYTSYVFSLLKDFFPQLPETIYMFDSNETMWGKENNGISILSPDEIEIVKPECILISNYIYAEEIYKSLQNLEKQGIKIVKLHEENEVPWVF